MAWERVRPSSCAAGRQVTLENVSLLDNAAVGGNGGELSSICSGTAAAAAAEWEATGAGRPVTPDAYSVGGAAGRRPVRGWAEARVSATSPEWRRLQRRRWRSLDCWMAIRASGGTEASVGAAGGGRPTRRRQLHGGTGGFGGGGGGAGYQGPAERPARRRSAAAAAAHFDSRQTGIGGFGGGQGRGSGGGGAGMGGAIFVVEGGSLVISGSFTVEGNAVSGGGGRPRPIGGISPRRPAPPSAPASSCRATATPER